MATLFKCNLVNSSHGRVTMKRKYLPLDNAQSRKSPDALPFDQVGREI